jgi:hypothetical protein
MNTNISDVQKTELQKVRKALGILGYKIFTSSRRHNRSEHGFVAIHKSKRSMCLLCPRKDRLEIRTYTYRVVNVHLIDYLRKRLSIPLRVGRRLPFKQYENGKRFVVKEEHAEFEMLLNDARL